MDSSIFSYISLYLPLIAFFAIAFLYHRKSKRSMPIQISSPSHLFPLWSFLYLPFSILYFVVVGYVTAHSYETLNRRFTGIYFAAGILILPALFYPAFVGMSLFMTSFLKKEAMIFRGLLSRCQAYVQDRILIIIWFIAVPLYPYARVEALTLMHGSELRAPTASLDEKSSVSFSSGVEPVFFRVISVHHGSAVVYAIYPGSDIKGKKPEAAEGYIIRFKREKGKWVYEEDMLLWGGNSDDYSFPPY